MKRRHWIALHRWTAILLGIHWLLLALTGVLLVFHREIETEWMGAGAPISAVRVEPAIAAAERALAGRATRVVIQDLPIRAYRVFVTTDGQERIATVDAASARLLSVTGASGAASPSGVARFLYGLHYQLLLGTDGEWIVGASGLFLLATALIGLWLGWPRRGQWLRTLRPKLRGKPWQKLNLLHRSVALIVAAFILPQAISGAGMVWGADLRGLLATAGLSTPAPAPAAAPGAPRLSPDAAIQRALAVYPDAQFVQLLLPPPGESRFDLRLRRAGEFRAVFGMTQVAIDGADGAIIARRDALASASGDSLLDALFSIHNGEWLGAFGRALTLAGGLLFFCAISFGLGSWWLRPSR